MSEEVVTRMDKETVASAQSLTRDEARYLVDSYYNMQKGRIRANNQIKAVERRVDIADVPTLRYVHDSFNLVERQIVRALKVFALEHKPGRWTMSIQGIGPVLSAGLLALVDVTKANHASSLTRFAGLDPTLKWERGQKRPYCGLLKVICWKIGESFKRLGAENESLYSTLYRERKTLEVERNEAGLFADQAHARLAEAKAGRWRISPLQRDIWSSGKLQAVGLDLRAMRYAVKKFLSHYYEVTYEDAYGRKPPKPWILEHGGHVDYIPVPNWPMENE